MKKIFLFLAVASTAIFTSCSSDDDSKANDPNAATAIVLVANVTSIELGESVTLTVTDNNAKLVTSTSKISANNVEITGATFTPDAVGTFVMTATHVNTNGVVISSNEVTVTVTAPVVASNSIVVDGVNYPTDSDSMLYYLGSNGNINIFVANPYKEVGTGETAEYPNDVYVYFTSTQVGTEFLDLPTTGNYDFGTTADAKKVIDANLIVGDNEILATEITTNASMNLTAIVGSETATTWAFTYSVLLANNTTAVGEYHGNWNFQNVSQPAAKVNAKKVVQVSNAQIKANLKALMARNK